MMLLRPAMDQNQMFAGLIGLMSGLGAVATSHGEQELARTLAAFDAFAQRLVRERQ